MKKYIITLVAFSAVLQGCLDTREAARENEEKHQLQKQVGTLQRTTADVNAKFQEVDEEVSKLSARVDVVDNKVSKNDDKADKSLAQRDAKIKETSEKVALHQEALTKMESQLSAMQAQINQLIEDQKKAPVATKAEGGEKGQYKVAQDFFDKKQWQDAAIAFENYRKANPKGKHAADALYKIGVSFQELGSKDEAKFFFGDVLKKYPNSPEARKATTRLKSLK